MELNANKVIETMSERQGQKTAQLEREIAFLSVQNEELMNEIKRLNGDDNENNE
jgi:hypothetical protein